MSIDVIGNFLTIIRNDLMLYKRQSVAPYSNFKLSIAQLLKDEGFIKDFKKDVDSKGHPVIKVFLKYVNGEPAINEITRVSRPGRRCYQGVNNITSVVGGLGVAILSTSSGIITDRKARELSVGGEVICHVW